MRAPAWSWALPLLLAGCAAAGSDKPKASAHPLAYTGPVAVSEMHRAEICNSTGSATRVTLLADAAAVQAWQISNRVDFFDGHPETIPDHPYALIELGERQGHGYSLLISHQAEMKDGILAMTATFLRPPPGQPSEGPTTSPCVLVTLPPLEIHDLVLLDPRRITRARWMYFAHSGQADGLGAVVTHDAFGAPVAEAPAPAPASAAPLAPLPAEPPAASAPLAPAAAEPAAPTTPAPEAAPAAAESGPAPEAAPEPAPAPPQETPGAPSP